MSNQDEREEEDIFDEPETSNDSEGDGEKDEVSAEEQALKVYNQRTGKSFKSWDDVSKSTKEADRLFAQGKHKKEEPKTTKADTSYFEERTLKKEYPESEFVMDELKEMASQKGVSPLELFESSKYFQGEAKAIASEKETMSENKGKVGAPSNGTPYKKDYSNISKQDALELSDEEFEKWSKAHE